MATSTARQSFTIAGLAHAAAVNIETVRYYQRRGLMQLRDELAQLVAACDANAEESCCPVIERLAH